MRKHVKDKLEKLQSKAKDKLAESKQQHLDAVEFIRLEEVESENRSILQSLKIRKKVDSELDELDKAL